MSSDASAALHWPGIARACGRLTKRRTACLGPAVDGIACPAHMTDEERSARRLRQLRGRRSALHARLMEPACWSWPLERRQLRHLQQAIVSAAGREESFAAATALLSMWQQDRCAICGTSRLDLELDHDHRTGWIRGYLCHGCNQREGKASEPGREAKYRERNPASILGFGVIYNGPWVGWAATKIRHEDIRNYLERVGSKAVVVTERVCLDDDGNLRAPELWERVVA